ncbi:MFS transporter [Phenylobacterium sp. LjRoot225]|uniref:MFS transporter n=1 Tax=Phenylobacterium sp. LjRoot225 TaxID=3342285 RepID=UPI003ED17437
MFLSEFKLSWQPLLAASIGLGLGSALGHYTLGLFGPALIAEFGWSKAQFALIGSMPLATLFLVPFAGRFTDRFGTRTAAMVGFTALPLGFLAFAMMSGNIVQFFAIWLLQHVFAILTTSMVFCRVVAEKFDKARGIALSLVMTAPPLAGAIAAPMLGQLIETEGWRAGYVALALVTAAGGLVAIVMMGRTRRDKPTQKTELRLTRKELGQLLRHPTLILILAGMLLVNIPQVVASSQLKLIVMDRGVASDAATWMLSLYAIGVMVGRILSGLALDRIQPHLVAIAALGLPAFGYLVFASPLTAIPILSLAVMVIGLAQGAESDIGAYLISRRFDMKNFSLLLSCVTAMIGFGSAVGSFILSFTHQFMGGDRPFLLVAAGATIVGAILFAMTGGRRARAGTPDAFAEEKTIEQAIAGEIG